MRRVLCIEDDPVVSQEIASELSRAGFTVECVADGAEGLARGLVGGFDVITLDRMLPGMDGLQVITSLRRAGIRTPVMMISALSNVDERLNGLRAGGDDYLVKPFASEEMAARIEVLLRRHEDINERVTQLNLDDLMLDLLVREVCCADQRMALPQMEFKLLEFLMRNAGKIVTRALIFEQVWGYHFDPGTKLIDVHLARLRRKLEQLGCRPSIKTIRGTGFVLATQ
ncbi:response regulator transcription factor [Pseudomonas silvicola]|nr:response regulator transcription factor [Pseudomonas silvicola]